MHDSTWPNLRWFVEIFRNNRKMNCQLLSLHLFCPKKKTIRLVPTSSPEPHHPFNGAPTHHQNSHSKPERVNGEPTLSLYYLQPTHDLLVNLPAQHQPIGTTPTNCAALHRGWIDNHLHRYLHSSNQGALAWPHHLHIFQTREP